MPPQTPFAGSPPGRPLRTEAAFDGILAALDADSDLVVIVVGSAEQAARALADRGISPGGRIRLAPASRTVAAGPSALREVRAHRHASVRVAATMVRDGHADAMVSVGPAEAAVAAAEFTMGLVPGATRPALAAVVDGRAGPVVLCDAGAVATASVDELAQFAVAGAAYAVARLGVAVPRVGLLSARLGLVDTLRNTADTLLSAAGVDYVGPVGADALVSGGVDVVVTDGFTGDVLLAALRAGGGAGVVDREAIVLGVGGITICSSMHLSRSTTRSSAPAAVGGHLAGDAVAGAVTAALTAYRAGLMTRMRMAMAGLLARRRALAGLT